jgi:hypothetical protein
MGRTKKYYTPEELAEANREKCKRYYEKNKDTLNDKRMKKYWEKKGETEI